MKSMVVSVLHPRDNGGYECRVPDFPGCITSGRDLEEAVTNIEDAANLWACDIETDGRPQPTISDYQAIPCEAGDMLHIVRVDTVEYRRHHDNKTVRKNVSLPAWMAYQAELRGLNCSKILQDALKQVLA